MDLLIRMVVYASPSQRLHNFNQNKNTHIFEANGIDAQRVDKIKRVIWYLQRFTQTISPFPSKESRESLMNFVTRWTTVKK